MLRRLSAESEIGICYSDAGEPQENVIQVSDILLKVMLQNATML
jgi:hypothetical protein